MKLDFKLESLEENGSNQRRATMGYRVFELLRQAIVQLQLRPGNLLSEAEVAKQMGLSRQPVREAFIKLSEAGLVEIRPQRGTFVVMISRREVENARFIREAVECAVVKKAAIEANSKGLLAMRGMILAQREADADGDLDEFLVLDEAFHQSIAVMAGYEHAWRLVESLKAQMDRVRYLSMTSATPVKTLIAQHEAIVDAIADKAPDRAEAAMRVHLSEILKSLPKVVEANKEMFVD